MWKMGLGLGTLKREESPAKLHYTVGNHRVSPYLELQADDLYSEGFYRDGFSHLDVNPYVRFFSIFNPLLTPDNMDVRPGMCKQDFYIGFLVRDMEQGAFGGLDELTFFTGSQKRVIAKWLLCFYQTGDGIGSLLGAVRALFPVCEVFIREGGEIVLHMREPQSEAAGKRLGYLVRLFLPLSCDYTVHWMETYGVIGYDETMGQEGFLLA